MAGEELLQTFAARIEDIIITHNKKAPDKRIWGTTVLWKIFISAQNQLLILGVYSGLSKVLELIQRILTDGSLLKDYKGNNECRSFVLNENNDVTDLFGSASIEGWLQLQLSTQVNERATIHLLKSLKLAKYIDLFNMWFTDKNV